MSIQHLIETAQAKNAKKAADRKSPRPVTTEVSPDGGHVDITFNPTKFAAQRNAYQTLARAIAGSDS